MQHAATGLGVAKTARRSLALGPSDVTEFASRRPHTPHPPPSRLPLGRHNFVFTLLFPLFLSRARVLFAPAGRRATVPFEFEVRLAGPAAARRAARRPVASTRSCSPWAPGSPTRRGPPWEPPVPRRAAGPPNGAPPRQGHRARARPQAPPRRAPTARRPAGAGGPCGCNPRAGGVHISGGGGGKCLNMLPSPTHPTPLCGQAGYGGPRRALPAWRAVRQAAGGRDETPDRAGLASRATHVPCRPWVPWGPSGLPATARSRG